MLAVRFSSVPRHSTEITPSQFASFNRRMQAAMFSALTPMTVVSSRPAPANLSTRWSLYFYVPKGAKTVGLFADGAGTLLDGSGNTLIKFDARKPGFHSIPVPKGQSGKLWKFHQCSGKRILLNVPPQLARNERELLLPKQLVDRDSK